MFVVSLLLPLFLVVVMASSDTQPWRPVYTPHLPPTPSPSPIYTPIFTPIYRPSQQWALSTHKLETDRRENRKQNQNGKQTKESGFHSTEFLHALGSNIFHLITKPWRALSEAEGNLTYDAEEKKIQFGELELSLEFAVEEFILIFTEIVAFIATDQLMRAVWPV